MKRTVAFLLMSACASSPQPEQPPAQPAATPVAPAPAPAVETPPAGPKPEFGVFGFDDAGMKPATAPGDNFYTYANGKWEETTQIPADRSNYGMFTRLDDLSNERTKEVIAEAAKTEAKVGSEAQKVGDYYASYMDEAAIEAKGLAPVKPAIDKIRKVKSKQDLAKILADNERTGTPSPFGMYIGADEKDPNTNAVQFGQAGIGLPDRDYYLKDDPKLAEIRKKYEAHIAAMFTLAKIDKAEARAKAIVELEKKIAEAHWTRVDSRDADKTYNKWKREEFAKKAPGFEWATYFKAVGVDKEANMIVGQTTAISGIAKLLGSQPIGVWQDWLVLQQLESSSDVLPKAFDDEHFAFFGKTLAGIPEKKARWKRAVEQVNAALGEAVGQLYVSKYFPPQAKEAADKLVKNLIVAMGARLDSLTWMAPETKEKAKQKLAAFTPKIGYPDKWRDYSALDVKRGDAFGNDDRAAEFEFNRALAKLGKPVDRSEWFMTPMMVNAYANPTFNEIVFPAAILQPPFFDANADPAVNYGGIGAVIGHEISHHFDDQGRKFDATGKLTEWWTADDAKRFEALTKQLVAQYAAYEPLPGQKLNGELTLGENIADLAGITIALDAYKKSLDGKAAPVIAGVTGEQRFFLGWAQVWRRKYREEELRNRLMTDPHSPSEYRAAVVRNIDGWYEAFKPQEKQALFLGQDKRVRIW